MEIQKAVAKVASTNFIRHLQLASRNLDVSSDDEVRTYLPSLRESLNGIRLLFREQKSSGIWDKYFPMFYYRKKDSPGGANYCFAFELLEAILYEFRHLILSDKRIMKGLWSACQWCDQNRLIYLLPDGTYCGWNSGQQVDSLQTGKPESWATATVHMFASALQEACSAEIQRLLLEKYRAQDSSNESSDGVGWDTLVDCDVELQSGAEDTVKGLLDKNIVSKVPVLDQGMATIPLRSRPWRKVELCDGRSALLFGPPGTSKTTIVKAMAAKIDWPYLEITPSHFLRAGLEKIYVESNSIFEDLMDLSGVVILFDEMDALVQRRSGAAVEQLDVTRQFLTTSMLPKLAKLHGNARVVFVMATNHRRQFDEAILRAGRFDLLICVGPPTWKQKAEKPDAWIRLEPKNPKLLARVCKRMVDIATSSPKVTRALDLFTIGEMKELVEFLRSQVGLEKFAKNGDAKQFQRVVSEWAERSITLRDGSDARTEYELYDKRASKVQR